MGSELYKPDIIKLMRVTFILGSVDYYFTQQSYFLLTIHFLKN